MKLTRRTRLTALALLFAAALTLGMAASAVAAEATMSVSHDGGTSYESFGDSGKGWLYAVGKLNNGQTIARLDADWNAVDGSFGGDTSAFTGGAILVPEGKTVTLDLNGYSINRGLASARENGCVIYCSGALAITGSGKITGGFTTNGGGVYVSPIGALSLSGAPQITGNKNSGGAASNVYLSSGKLITIVGGGLSDGASIGVTTQNAPAEAASVSVAETSRLSDGKYFFSDNTAYSILTQNESASKSVVVLTKTSGNTSGDTGTYDGSLVLGLDNMKQVKNGAAQFAAILRDVNPWLEKKDTYTNGWTFVVSVSGSPDRTLKFAQEQHFEYLANDGITDFVVTDKTAKAVLKVIELEKDKPLFFALPLKESTKIIINIEDIPAIDADPEGDSRTVSCRTLNVRSGAGTTYAKLGVLMRGDKVTVLEIVGGWAKIEYNGQTGYVAARYLT